MAIMLFDCWNLPVQKRLNLLGASQDNEALLDRFRKGMPLANDSGALERISILLSIHQSLRILFPHNRELAYSWMTTPNRAFDKSTPTQVIEQQGMMGFYIVIGYLNRKNS